MSINKGQFTVGRKVETLSVIEWDVSLNTIDGMLPAWAGGGGVIHGTFTGEPRTGTCSIELRDGSGGVILSVPAAAMQGEAGPDEAPFHTWAGWSASGQASDGRQFAFKTAPFNPDDPTSLNIDFAVAETNSVKDAQAVKVWAGEVQAVTGLPVWIEAWLSAYGVSASKFEKWLHEKGNKINAPAEFQQAVTDWFVANTQLTGDKILAFVALAVAELKSGKPGYTPDHGGVA